jgi:SPOR domain
MGFNVSGLWTPRVGLIVEVTRERSSVCISFRSRKGRVFAPDLSRVERAAPDGQRLRDAGEFAQDEEHLRDQFGLGVEPIADVGGALLWRETAIGSIVMRRSFPIPRPYGRCLKPKAVAPQPVDQTAAHKSGDWAIQFSMQKSEAQAKVNVARLNAKYAATLKRAKIGVNKTLVNGETIYALRVTGLYKADAAALCERLKGRDCLITQ